jgi:hypothetical protein
LDSSYAVSNQADKDGILRVIQIHSTTFFRVEVKPLAPCCKILRRVKKPEEYEGDISSAKLTDISRQVSPDSPLVVSVGNCQEALVDGSVMITTRDAQQIKNGRSAWDAL